MKKIIKTRGLYLKDPFEEKEVTILKCNVENIVYMKNEITEYKEDKYIAYDYQTGSAVCLAENTKKLIEKVDGLKEKIENCRKEKYYKELVINDQLF